MYSEYWSLHKAPFDNVTDPSMYADCHLSMEKVISETIFAIKESNEAFAVIIGEAGSGKTLSLKMIIDALETEKYKSVAIKNPGIAFTEFLQEIIAQITSKPCKENKKAVLLEIFNHLLFTTNNHGQKIVIFVDEADTLSPANLENLRLLTNIQDDQRNFFTLVLAGQIDLARRLEHPKMANLFQRIGTFGRIDKLPSEEAVKTYIETRLKFAGTNNQIFSDDSIPVIWEYSEHGIPHLINKICNLCLKTAENYGFDYISANTAREISERFQNISAAAIQHRKPRNRPDDMDGSHMMMAGNAPEETVLTETAIDKGARYEMAEPALQTASAVKQEAISDAPEILTSIIPAKESPLEESLLKDRKDQQSENDNYDDVMIGEYKIQLAIPEDILKQVKLFNRESANKSAGFWAAKIIKNNPQLTSSPLADPVYIWNEIKDSILKKIAL